MIRKKKTSIAVNIKAAKITIKEIRKEEDDRLAMWVPAREREREREREPCRREEKVCVVLSVGLMIFKIFTTMPLSNVTQKLKTTLDVFSKYSV